MLNTYFAGYTFTTPPVTDPRTGQVLNPGYPQETRIPQISESEVEFTAIRAPFDGRTGSVQFHEGNVVKAPDDTLLAAASQLTADATIASSVDRMLAGPDDRFFSGRMLPDGRGRPRAACDLRGGDGGVSGVFGEPGE